MNPVLLFAAEDAGHIVRTRLAGIARAAGADFETLDIAVIDVPTLRLDHRADRQRLLETVERIEPRLLVLDPLVRLRGVDENAAGEVAPILGFLRDLQRRFERPARPPRPQERRHKQALRGSSELHAWGDSNLYLRRRDGQIVMTVEHRAAPGLNDIEIELADNGEGPALRLRRTVPAAPEPETQRIVSRRSRNAALAAPDPGARRHPPPSPCIRSSSKDVSSVFPRADTASPIPGPTMRPPPSMAGSQTLPKAVTASNP